MEKTTSILWSVEESGNLADLTEDDDGMLEMKKEVKEEF
jgi:hypothetical protein